MTRLTPSRIKALRPGKSAADHLVRGLRAKGAKGGAVWEFRYTYRGRRMSVRIGRFPELGIKDARSIAQGLALKVADGGNPAGERAKPAPPTVDELMALALREHWEQHAKPSTIKKVRECWRNHISPGLGSRLVEGVTHGDVAGWHATVGRKTPGAANRALAYLSKGFSVAKTFGHVAENPCLGIRKFKGKKIERFLSDDEYRRLSSALLEQEQAGAHLPALVAIAVLMFTGLRRGEALGLRWDDIDHQNGEFVLRDSKTGARRVSVSGQVMELISRIERRCEFVFPSKRGGRPMSDCRSVWVKVRGAAGLDDVRLHDLRHSYASLLARQGKSLLVIGQLLGHRSVNTTARYAHLADKAKAKAAADAGAELAAILGG